MLDLQEETDPSSKGVKVTMEQDPGFGARDKVCDCEYVCERMSD